MAEINDNTKNFIDQLSQGKNDEAGEAFKASLRDKDGYLYVDYNKLDVEFKRIN